MKKLLPILSFITPVKKILWIFFLPFTFINFVYSQDLLPKGAKLERIEYSVIGEVAIGYVYKNKFVENQKVTLLYLRRPSNSVTDTIISGTYFTKDGIAYIEGVYYDSESYNEVKKYIYKGLFQVSNTEKNEFTANPKKTYKYTSDGRVRKFNSKIERREITNFKQYESSRQGKEIKNTYMEKQTDGTYSLKIEYFNNKITTVESQTSKLKPNIEQSQPIEITFRNNDVLVGTVGAVEYSDYRVNGEYRFSTGETIIKNNFYVSTSESGNSFGQFNYLINDILNSIRDGKFSGEKTIFADGSVAESGWFKQYNLTSDDIWQIFHYCKTLTQIRDKAVQFIEEKQRKLQEKQIAKAREEQALQERKQNIIAEYGEHYGALISKGEIDVGMSQEMVNWVWSRDYFVVSKSARNGQSMEIWEFSKDKMQMAILNEGAKNKDSGGGEAALAAIFALGLAEQLGGMRPPQMLIFTNGKLTDIYR